MRNPLFLTRPDGLPLVIDPDAVSAVEPATGLDGPSGCRARLNVSGSERFVAESPEAVLLRMGVDLDGLCGELYREKLK